MPVDKKTVSKINHQLTPYGAGSKIKHFNFRITSVVNILTEILHANSGTRTMDMKHIKRDFCLTSESDPLSGPKGSG